MIIFGTRGVTSTAERGSFHCPQCAGQTNYNTKRVRRFFTLYFIPLIPLDKLGEYVECAHCQATFDPEILTYDPSEQSQKMEALFFVGCKQVMISMLLADGVVDESEVKMLQTQFQQITGTHVPIDELNEEISYISQQGSSGSEMMTALAPQLNDSGKEMVIRSAYAIANADGNFDASEQQYLNEIGQALGMSNAHINGILASISTPPPLSGAQA